PSSVKVVTAGNGRALYFSRAAIPYDRDNTGFTAYRKHLGIYAYRKDALRRFATLPPSPLERVERLEQLRLLDNGIDIHVADAPSDTIITPARQWHRHPRCGCSQRYHRRRHGRGFRG